MHRSIQQRVRTDRTAAAHGKSSETASTMDVT